MGKVLGLTGTIGSGKTTVARMFAEAGVPVIDADRLAHDALAIGSPALEEVWEVFGHHLRQSDGSLDRKALAERVFTDPRELARLTAIVHPIVRQGMLAAMESLAGEPLVLLDVPLLYETDGDQLCDRVAVVVVSERQRFKRLRERGLSEREVIGRMRHQMAQARKAARADYVIDNDGSLECTRQQIGRILSEWIG